MGVGVFRDSIAALSANPVSLKWFKTYIKMFFVSTKRWYFTNNVSLNLI